MAGPVAEDVSYADVARELETFVRRLRDLAPGRLSGSRAAVARHVVDVVASWALAVEGAHGAAPAANGAPAVPDLGVGALADQLAVVGHDLLAARPDRDLLLAAFAELAWHRSELDGSAPGPKAVRLLAGAFGVPQTVLDVLDAAAGRCPQVVRR